MKNAVALSVLLLLAGGGAGALLADTPGPAAPARQPAALLEDLVRMTRSGASEVTVLAYAKAHRMELPPELSDARLRWLRDSGVSELVVRYMAAVDLRASAETNPAVAPSSSSERASRARAAYSSASRDRYSDDRDSDDRDSGGRDSGGFARDDGYTDRDYGAYAGYDDDGESYPYAYTDTYSYSPFGYGYASSPYTSYFFVDRGGSFRRFRFHGKDGRDGRHGRDDRDSRGRGHRDFDRGPGPRGHGRQGYRGDAAGHRGPRDAWRDRGPGGRRGGSVAAGPRGSGRPAFAGGGRRGPGPRGPGNGDHGFSARSGFGHGPGAPRGGAGGHGGFGRHGFSGAPHGDRAGFQGSNGMSGGARSAGRPPRGSGRR